MLSKITIAAVFLGSLLAAEQGSITPLTVPAPRDIRVQPPQKDIMSLYDTVIPHIVYGGTEWQTMFIFHNPSYVREEFSLYFYGDDGRPAYIPIVGATYSALRVEIPPYGTLKATTDYRAGVPQGWCFGHVDTLQGNFDNTYMQTIFKQHVAGRQDSEAAVSPEASIHTEQVLTFDQEQGYVMGVALANPWLAATIRADIYDADGNLIGTSQFWMARESHTAFALPDRFPETQNRIGSIVFATNGWGLVGIGLRFSPNGPFTSMPMLSSPLRD